MADAKITELTENTSPSNDDVFPIVNAILTLTQKIKWEIIRGAVVIYSDTAPVDPVDGTLWVDTSVRLDLPVTSADVSSIVSLTQVEYDALTPDAAILYVITA